MKIIKSNQISYNRLSENSKKQLQNSSIAEPISMKINDDKIYFNSGFNPFFNPFSSIL